MTHKPDCKWNKEYPRHEECCCDCDFDRGRWLFEMAKKLCLELGALEATPDLIKEIDYWKGRGETGVRAEVKVEEIENRNNAKIKYTMDFLEAFLRGNLNP